MTTVEFSTPKEAAEAAGVLEQNAISYKIKIRKAIKRRYKFTPAAYLLEIYDGRQV